MKKIAFILLSVAALVSCDKSKNKYTCYEPVYTNAETFRAPAVFESPKSITHNGNIYYKDDILFVVEPNEGIHFIDNSNPTNPINTGFLKIQGASGLAIKDNYLYVTALVDLVTIDVSNYSAPIEVDRQIELFPTALPLMEKNYPTKTIDKNKGVVTSWNPVKVEEDNDLNWSPIWTGCLGCETFTTFDSGGISNGSASSSGAGTSGSYALMTIHGNHLYVVDNWSLLPIDISSPLNMQVAEQVYLPWDVETIFPNAEHLYMGTTTGMLIYETTNPDMPTRIGSIAHARACDPVVVQGDYAYVTVRSNGRCGGDINQLDVVNIADKTNPWLVESFEMNDPHGVGVDGNTVFICDGDEGLKVFNDASPSNIGNSLIKRYKAIEAVDIIPMNGVAMVIGENGIFQYDYSDLDNVHLLSEIKF
jgi:hypothetical protein